MAVGTARDIHRVQYYLWWATGVQLVVAMLFFSYYPWTRQFVFTYFASPATYGVLTSERFSSLFWWICSFTTLSIFPLWFNGFMQVHFTRRSYQWAWTIIAIIWLAIWLVMIGYMTAWLIQRNNPSMPNNPANSYRACCVPEFYNVVGACPNFGQPHPECDPGINIDELGTNGDFVFFYFITVTNILMWIIYIVLGFALLKLTEILNREGDPSSPLYQLATSKPGDGSVAFLPATSVPAAASAQTAPQIPAPVGYANRRFTSGAGLK